MQNKSKSVHFASQDTQHTIPTAAKKAELRTLTIEDESQTPSAFQIREKQMKLLMDSSTLSTDKQLKKLAKDGVIFLRAPNNKDNNPLRANASKLRSIIMKLLSKYQFVEKVTHPKYDSKESVLSNGGIPSHAIKAMKPCLRAVFVGSVGQNEPKWRSFWEWTDGNSETETLSSIAPESQSSLFAHTPITTQPMNNKREVRFSELSDEDKKTIYEWAVKREQTAFIKKKISNLFKAYAQSDTALEWQISIVNPLWFRTQSIGTPLHCDIDYIFAHTNLLKRISGQKLLISGFDLKNKELFVGKLSQILRQKLCKSECPLCGYTFTKGVDSESAQLQSESEYIASENESQTKNANKVCESCRSEAQYGLFTVWTALDFFDCPFSDGSMVFALGSHNKAQNSRNWKWGYASAIGVGDMFVFNIKTLHGAGAAKDGFLRASVDMRVGIKPSQLRYERELSEMKEREMIGLGLSQLCSQMPPNNDSPELTTTTQSKHLSYDNFGNNNHKPLALKRSKSSDDIESMEIDGELQQMSAETESKNEGISAKDLLTQDSTQSCSQNSETQNENERTKTLTPVMTESTANESGQNGKNESETPQKKSNYKNQKIIPSPPSLQRSNNNSHSNATIPETQMSETQTNPNILPSQTQKTQIPRLEPQNSQNRFANNINIRKRMFSEMDRRLSQTIMTTENSNHKRQKLLHSSNSNNNNNTSFMFGQYGNANLNHFSTISDEELCRKVSVQRSKINKSFHLLQSQMNETLSLMELANQRYLFTKQKEIEERERANHFQAKNENLQKRVMENHNVLFKMFEQ